MGQMFGNERFLACAEENTNWRCQADSDAKEWDRRSRGSLQGESQDEGAVKPAGRTSLFAAFTPRSAWLGRVTLIWPPPSRRKPRALWHELRSAVGFRGMKRSVLPGGGV